MSSGQPSPEHTGCVHGQCPRPEPCWQECADTPGGEETINVSLTKDEAKALLTDWLTPHAARPSARDRLRNALDSPSSPGLIDKSEAKQLAETLRKIGPSTAAPRNVLVAIQNVHAAADLLEALAGSQQPGLTEWQKRWEEIAAQHEATAADPEMGNIRDWHDGAAKALRKLLADLPTQPGLTCTCHLLDGPHNPKHCRQVIEAHRAGSRSGLSEEDRSRLRVIAAAIERDGASHADLGLSARETAAFLRQIADGKPSEEKGTSDA